ncbi:hypothetical protein SDJN02_06789, partial [Cucurbita argyrosperma subsp. argyrosperma]
PLNFFILFVFLLLLCGIFSKDSMLFLPTEAPADPQLNQGHCCFQCPDPGVFYWMV